MARASTNAMTAGCLLAMLVSCSNEPVTYELSGATMGTSFNVQIVSPPQRLNRPELKDEIIRTLAAIEQSMSTYLADSELSRFNAHKETGWFDVSQALCTVVTDAQEISRMSGGAFDISIGPLVNLWGFGPESAVSEPPDSGRITELLQATGHDKLHADCSRPALRKDHPQLQVDLSAYAKGYGVDRVAELLRAEGVANFLVEIGGEVRAAGQSARGSEWNIAVELPERDSRRVARVVPLTDGSMATSGDYRIYFENAGTYYSHTIDPRTGYPVTHNGAAVTVIADTAAYADGMATALLVLGPVEGLRLAEQQNLAALFQLRADDTIGEQMSTRFAREFSAL